MTQRRRVIYMDDETWQRLRELAMKGKTTMSEILRRLLREKR